MDRAPETAAVLVAAAKRLENLPDIDDALCSGAIGYDRAAAMSRLAGHPDASDLLQEAAGSDIAGIRNPATRRRRMTRRDELDAFAGRYVSIQPNLDESAWYLPGRLPGYAGQVVFVALETGADTFPHAPGTLPLCDTRNADALRSISLDSLQGGDRVSLDTTTPTVSVFVEATEPAPANGEAGVHVAAGPQVGPNTVEAILCTGVIEVTARAQAGQPLAYGRLTRVIPPRPRRFIVARDGGVCAIAGCVSRCRLQAHHIAPWSGGGRADPDNLTSLCWFHHHVVIRGHRFRVDPNSPSQRRRLLNPRIHAPPGRASTSAASTGR